MATGERSKAEILDTLRELHEFARELAASAMLAGEDYPDADRANFYSQSCQAMNRITWVIDELARSEQTSLDDATLLSRDKQAFDAGFEAGKDWRSEQASPWISTATKLPDEGQHVLIYRPEHDGGRPTSTLSFHEGKFVCICCKKNAAFQPTHWQPLPSPPVAEKGTV